MKCAAFVLLMFFPVLGFALDVVYDINVDYQTMNFTGKNVKGITLSNAGESGEIPGPTLEFTEGDNAVITIHNNLNEETSIHWHGLLVPNDQDGVPHITNKPIKGHSSYTYRFPIKQNGTYWYHSHTSLQEQKGVYGPIVIHAKNEVKYDYDQVVLFSDWTNENPNEVMRDLKTDPEYQQQCKDTQRTWSKDLREHTVNARLKSEWNRMGPMDVADVCYSGNGAFLINGRRQSKFESILPGQTARLRFINAATSTYFHVAFGKQPIQVISADGKDVVPVAVNGFKIGSAETYDVLVTMPKDISVELRATSNDVTGHTSVFFGTGPMEKAPDVPKPPPYMDMSGGSGSHNCKPNEHWDDKMKMCMPNNTNLQATNYSQILKMDDDCTPGEPGCGDDLVPLNYGMLKSVGATTLDPRPTKEIELDLDGNMRTYVWSFNKKVFGDSEEIIIQKGSNVRIKFVNKTMMAHPIHIHGHFFRLLNGQEDFSPLKHTVDIAPMQSTMIEFYANIAGKWLMHCHIGPHMIAGMDLVFNIQSSGSSQTIVTNVITSLPDSPSKTMSDMSGKQWFLAGKVGATNYRSEAEFKAIEKDWELMLRAEYEPSDSKTRIRSEVTQNTSLNTGIYAGAEVDTKKDHLNPGARKTITTGEIGIKYRTPGMINITAGVTTDGKLSFSAEKELALFKKTSVNLMFERKYGITEWHAFVERRIKKRWLLRGGPSERGGFEGGIQFRP